MKTTMFKIAFVFLMSFTMIQSSEAYGRYYNRCAPRAYYAPRVYCAPRVYAPVIAPCYGRVLVPGHWFVNRYGVRAFARPYYR